MICPKCHHENQDGLDSCFKCGESFVAAITVREGTLIAGRYEIRAPLGKGGMGMVYVAFDRTLEETVAIKLLRPDAALNPDVARRFRTEIKLARRISHKNVCRIHEYGEDQGLRYICMEYVEGTNLRQILTQRGGLPLDEALDIAIQVAQGLEAIHEVGVVHRDLKTANIMRDPRGVVRLMDFGIAKQLGLEATSGATATGFIVGTPDYMSPEQARGESVDLRSDIYSLGIVLYELLTGELPFRAETPVATIFKQVHEDPRLDRPGIPATLQPILRRALQKDPGERHPSARALVDALDEARATQAAGTTRPATPPAIPSLPKPTPGRAGAPTTLLPGTPQPTAPPSPPAGATAVPERLRRSTPPTRRSPAGVTAPMPMPHPAAPGPMVASRAAVRVGLWLAPVAVVAVVVPIGAYVIWAKLLGAPSGSERPTSTPTSSPRPQVSVETVPSTTPTLSVMPRPTATSTATPAPQATATPTSPREPARPVLVLGGGPVARPSAVPSTNPTPTPTATVLPVVALPATPQPAPTARPTPTPPPLAAERGALQLTVVPWAEVSVDGASVGRTSTVEIPLTPGPHVVRLNHPDYQPLQRRISVSANRTTQLVVDLAEDAIPKK